MYYYRDDDLNDVDDFRLYDDDEMNEVGEYEVRPICPFCQYYYGYGSDSSMMRQQMPPFGSPSNSPSGPPPNFVPNKNQVKSGAGGPSLKAIDSGSIKPCLYRYVYIWQTNGRSYWAYLTYVGKKSVAGFRWMGFRWVYFGLDLDRIESFYCR